MSSYVLLAKIAELQCGYDRLDRSLCHCGFGTVITTMCDNSLVQLEYLKMK